MPDLLEADVLEDELPDGEEPVEPAEGAEPAEGEIEGEQPEVTSLFEADGAKVAKPIRDALAKLKAENPSIAKLVTGAVFRQAELTREFPGGMAEVRELRDKVEQAGGFPEIEAKFKTAEQFNEMAGWFEKGDPAFVDDMIESSPEAFAKLAPIVFDRLEKMAPEVYGGYIARVIASDLNSTEIPVPIMMMRLADFVPKDKPEAVDLFNAINGYLGKFARIAAKAPTVTRQPAKTQPNNEDQREIALRAREWGIEDQEVQGRFRNSAYTKALAGRVPNTEEKAMIKELFLTRSAAKADQVFKDWKTKAQGYINRNDKAGYLRFMGSIHARVIPEVVASAVAATMKGKTAPPKKAATPQNGTPVKPAEGFKMLAKEPDTWALDLTRSGAQALLRENKGYMKDGTKVQWR